MLSKVMGRMVTLFTAAFGVVAALAWDDTVKTMFQMYYPFPGTESELRAKFTYAMVVTGIAVCITTIFASMVSKEKESKS